MTKINFRLYKRSFNNLGQNVGEKSTKLSKIGFGIECFTADSMLVLPKKRQSFTLS